MDFVSGLYAVNNGLWLDWVVKIVFKCLSTRKEMRNKHDLSNNFNEVTRVSLYLHL